VDTTNAATVELAGQITRTITGPMWHGPVLTDVLEGVTADVAHAHPIHGAHSIWEIVHHITAWAEIARARLKGERLGDPTPDEDWPPAGHRDTAAWVAAIERLRASHRELAQSVTALDASTLDITIPGLEYSPSELLRGIVEHGVYHGGQIMLLRKASNG